MCVIISQLGHWQVIEGSCLILWEYRCYVIPFFLLLLQCFRYFFKWIGLSYHGLCRQIMSSATVYVVVVFFTFNCQADDICLDHSLVKIGATGRRDRLIATFELWDRLGQSGVLLLDLFKLPSDLIHLNSLFLSHSLLFLMLNFYLEVFFECALELFLNLLFFLL